MLEPTLHLVRTLDVGATKIDLSFHPRHWCSATWTGARHLKNLLRTGPSRGYYFDYRWDDFPRLLDYNNIPNPDIFPFDLLTVVQSRPGYRCTADENRL
jgi:hypothetical protein